MQILVTGGTGLIGSRLVQGLLKKGHVPVILTRREAAARKMFGEGCKVVEGNPMRPGDWQKVAADCDGVVNLAGENLFNHRWNDKFKAIMTDSRIQATRNVVAALSSKPRRADGQPKTLVNGSAIGIYGPHDDDELTEDSSAASDFLAKLCVDWETEARKVEASGVRLALVRIGIVLDIKGGALAPLRMQFRLGMGGPVGNGTQWMSWIHHEDMTGILLLALENPAAVGPINATAPNPVTNRDFGTALGKALHRPSFMPTPRFMLRAMLGEVADVAATGQRVAPKRALALGYVFKYPQIDAALAEIFALKQ
jgi:uncharacterized protein